MKKFWLLTLWIILITWTLAGCNNKSSNTNTWDVIIEDISWENEAVINYNDKLVGFASDCIISENGIWNIYDTDDYSIEDVKSAINETISICSNAKKEIDNLWDWEWDSSLKDGAIVIIEKEIEYINKFNESLPYLENEENLSEEDKEIYEWIVSEIQAINQELLDANDDIVAIQDNFAKTHWFELEDDTEVTE